LAETVQTALIVPDDIKWYGWRKRRPGGEGGEGGEGDEVA